MDILVVADVEEDAVYNGARELKPSMTTGPDLITSMVIRNCAALLVPILSYIFQIILRTRKFPSLWKLSKVCPIQKEGPANSASISVQLKIFLTLQRF